MMSYWLYKYEIEDRDITVVDYSKIEEAITVKLPIATLCLLNPFVEAKVKSFNSSISLESYINYLKGHIDRHYHKYPHKYCNIRINIAMLHQ